MQCSGRIGANGAHRKALLSLFRGALVALCVSLFDRGHLTEVPRGAAVQEGHVGRKAHSVHVASCVHIVERVHHDSEYAEEIDAEFCVLDVPVVRDDSAPRVELERCLACNLFVMLVSFVPVFTGRKKKIKPMQTNNRFGFANVFLSEQELSVQVAHIYCIEINL